ncbi:MAG: YceI family protein [Chitinophagaceae bacterium]|nr:YceI family protein [Chitinophagaceae bacterium]
MIRKITLTVFSIALSASVFAQSRWTVDPYHSSLNFTIKHSGISMVNGKFMDYAGSLTTNGEALENAQFDFTIQTTSINTNVEPRDNHLRSADFFEVDKHPTLTFRSTKILKTGKPDQYLLYGKLTIKGVTKDVIADLTYGGVAASDKGDKIGMKATAVINRFDYGINYDPAALGVGKDVYLEVHLQFAKQS